MVIKLAIRMTYRQAFIPTNRYRFWLHLHAHGIQARRFALVSFAHHSRCEV